MQDLFDQTPSHEDDLFPINASPWDQDIDEFPIFNDQPTSPCKSHQENMIFEETTSHLNLFQEHDHLFESNNEVTDFETKSRSRADVSNAEEYPDREITEISGGNEITSTDSQSPNSNRFTQIENSVGENLTHRPRMLSKEVLALSETYLKETKVSNQQNQGILKNLEPQWSRMQLSTNSNTQNLGLVNGTQHRVSRSPGQRTFDFNLLEKDLCEINELEKLKNQYSREFDYHNYVRDMLKNIGKLSSILSNSVLIFSNYSNFKNVDYCVCINSNIAIYCSFYNV